MDIRRPLYLQKLIDRRNNRMIKIITGLRRSGKSYLLFRLYKQYLLDNGTPANQIIEADLEDFNLYSLREPSEMLSYISSKTTDAGQYYVFIDEVQHLVHFEDVLNTLLKRGNLEVHVHTLSFAEFQSAYPETPYSRLLTDYMLYGGMPQLTDCRTAEQKEEYLKSLFAETYLKDIRERYNIRDDSDLEELINIVASSVGSMQNPLKLQNSFKSVKHSCIGQETVKRYLDHLQDAFLIEKAVRYDIKGKRYISTPSKYYFEDLGLRNARLNFRQFEPTHLMENLIYNELRIRGFSVDVGQVIRNMKDNNGVSQRQVLEVDFVCNRGYKRCYIQSAYSMPSYDKIEQELRSLVMINDAFLKVVITADITPTHQTDDGVMVINLQDFLNDKNILPM